MQSIPRFPDPIMPELWAKFRKAIAADELTTGQEQDMRICFYAGARSILHIIAGILNSRDEATGRAHAVQERLHIELEKYLKEVGAIR